MATDRPRFTVSLEQELFDKVEEYRIKNGYATRSKAVEALIRESVEVLIAQNRISDIQKPSSGPFPSDLATHMEKLIDTLTPEQAALLAVLVKKIMYPIKVKANQK